MGQMIDGLLFHRHGVYKEKKDALAAAKLARKVGFKTRVRPRDILYIKGEGPFHWDVFVHETEKTKERGIAFG